MGEGTVRWYKVSNNLEGLLNGKPTKFHTYTQCNCHVSIHVLRITDIWCPPAFHEVTCYAVDVYNIGLVCTCAWQDMYVHSTLATHYTSSPQAQTDPTHMHMQDRSKLIRVEDLLILGAYRERKVLPTQRNKTINTRNMKKGIGMAQL